MKNKYYKPPKFIFWVLEKLFENDIAESALGEYEENYNYLRINEGGIKANYWFYVEFINVMADRLLLSMYRSIIMLRNYIIVAFRNMARQKVYSFINILGLSIGIACSLLVFLYVQDEYSYDKFHENSGRLYRVWAKEYNPERGREIFNAATPYMLPDVLRRDYPEVEFSIHYDIIPLTVKKDGNIFSESILATEPGFLKMFTFRQT
ncbi:ABC transporter permease [candidate division KSB1 bacterium]|nr:ABC transporter permease [candidate division KSB1 bacterium]